MTARRPAARPSGTAAPSAAGGGDVRGAVSEAPATAGLVVTPAAEPTPALAGLTGDERRAHRALLGALAPAERARVEALDLGAIDGALGRLAEADALEAASGVWGGGLAYAVAALVGLMAVGMGLLGQPTVALAAALTAALTAGMGALSMAGWGGKARGSERALYLALRERALARPVPVRPS